ncbi:MAG TPA: helix-turn-helix transcriptional regulator [Steroidobacteraceae bacterium]|nr:helix-turn-helix transcriptional regulator [Steroidobacteraceae bacterium]
MGAYRSAAAGELRARGSTTRRSAPSLDDPRFEARLLRLHASIDIRQFWAALLAILDGFLPHDACVAYLDYVDYARTWDASRILTTPNARRSRKWLERRREVNMMPAFALSNPGIKLYRLSEVVPDRRRLRESEFFRRYMAAEGWYYSACALFWRADRLASEIAIRRTAQQGEFTAREMAFLQRLHPHLETTLQRLSAAQRRAGSAASAPDAMLRHDTMRALPGELTVAERELVQFVRIGFSNKEIAARLDKSVRTVKTQLTSVYKKCGVRSRSRLLALMMPRLSYD